MASPKHAPTQDDYAQAAALREALRLFQRRSEAVTAANGLTSRAYHLLLMIKTARADHERVGLAELEERLQLGKSTVTELVLRSEKHGLVRRELDRRRSRGISVGLTARGRQRLEKVVGELGDERRSLIELLSQLKN